jgi:GT2 family glycosyltransferase
MISVHIVSYNNSLHTINAVRSVFQTVQESPVEVLVIECGSLLENQIFFEDYRRRDKDVRLKYISNMGNLGLAGGLNYLASIQSPHTKYVVELNNDMFFGPGALDKMMQAAQDPTIGLVGCTLICTGFDRRNPKKADVDSFASTHASDNNPPKPAFGASNLPWLLPIDFFNELKDRDAWDPPVKLNRYPGIWDEVMDPYLTGWCADWDVHNRVLACGRQVVVLENAFAYHYDHCSIESLGEDTSWQKPAVRNYILKYGHKADMYQFGMGSKGIPMVRKPKPTEYPVGR